MQNPEPGIYEDIPFETYCEWDAVNASRLKLAVKSLRHYQAGHSDEETPALRFGSLTHCGRLEPLAVTDRYAVMPRFELDKENVTKDQERTRSKSTKYYQDKKRQWEKDVHPRQSIDKADWDRMLAIIASLKSNAAADEALRGTPEVTLVWVDEQTGILCKARLDCWERNINRITDLKTTRDISRFNEEIRWRDRNYHLQMAHYAEGVKAHVGKHPECWFVPVENVRPFDCAAAPLGAMRFEQGMQLRNEAMRKVAQAQAANHWPGVGNPESWDMEEWEVNKMPAVVTLPDGTTLEV